MMTPARSTLNLTTALLMAASRLQVEAAEVSTAGKLFRLGLDVNCAGKIVLRAAIQGFALERVIDPVKDDLGQSLRDMLTELKQQST